MQGKPFLQAIGILAQHSAFKSLPFVARLLQCATFEVICNIFPQYMTYL